VVKTASFGHLSGEAAGFGGLSRVEPLMDLVNHDLLKSLMERMMIPFNQDSYTYCTDPCY